MIRWAAKDQAELGLDVITDGEAYRENMYYFYQKRVDGVTFENMPRLTFGEGGFRHRMSARDRPDRESALQSRA